jgi:hypothetical protein
MEHRDDDTSRLNAPAAAQSPDETEAVQLKLKVEELQRAVSESNKKLKQLEEALAKRKIMEEVYREGFLAYYLTVVSPKYYPLEHFGECTAQVYPEKFGASAVRWGCDLFSDCEWKIPDSWWSAECLPQKARDVGSEGEVQILVSYLVGLVARTIDPTLRTGIERNADDVLPLLLLQRKSQVTPIGMIIVKSPQRNGVEPDLLIHDTTTRDASGKLYDQLLALKSRGLVTPLIMVTDWNFWQLVGLYPATPMTTTNGSSAPIETADRTIYVSEIVSRKNGTKLGLFLSKTIALMLAAPLDPFDIRSDDPNSMQERLLPVFDFANGRSFFASVSRKDLGTINRECFPRDPEKKILYGIGYVDGESSRTFCEAVTADGQVSMIKAWFPYLETGERIEAAQTECARWNCIYRDYWWQNFCHVVTMDNVRVFLVLPFVHSIETDEKAKVLVDGLRGELGVALHFLAVKGYRHDTICWKHVKRAHLKDGTKPLVFTGLDHVAQLKWNVENRKKWIKKVLRALKDELERSSPIL